MTTDDARQTLEQALEVAREAESLPLTNHVLRGTSLKDALVTRFTLTADLSAEAVADVRRAAESMLDKQLLTYDPSYQTSGSQVMVEALAEIPELARVDTLIRLDDVPDDQANDPVVAMSHSVGVGTDQIVAIRMKGAGIATRRGGFPLVPSDGIYQRVEGEILYYEPSFDVITAGGFAFFTAVTLIQTKLQAPEKAREQARQTLKKVTKQVRIEGYDELEAAVMDDPTMRAKMAHVARRISADPSYAAVLTTEKLVTFVTDHPEYEIATVEAGGERRLSFETSPQHRHKIPRLLADDYLHSYLTNRSYEAGSKQEASHGSNTSG